MTSSTDPDRAVPVGSRWFFTDTDRDTIPLFESSYPDIQMGFCMENSGMTQSGQGEPPSDLEMLGSLEEPEGETMEDGHNPEFGPMTVEIKSQRVKTDLPSNNAASRAPDLKDIFGVDPLHQGQALLAAGKKRKKKQKRADKIATNLSDTLTAAMDFSFSDN